MDNFSNQIAVITGASQGVGKELALGFSRMVLLCVFLILKRMNLRAVNNEISDEKGKSFVYVTDVSDSLPG